MTGRSVFYTPPKVSNDSTSELSSICACHIHLATRLRLLFSPQSATPLRQVQALTRKSPQIDPRTDPLICRSFARDISVKDIENNLMTSLGGSPPLDIVIRTSGVKRLSDFLLWQVGTPMLGTDTSRLLTKIYTVLRRYPTAFFVDLLARFWTMGFRPHYPRLPAQSLVKVRSMMIVTSSFVIVRSLTRLVSPTRATLSISQYDGFWMWTAARRRIHSKRPSTWTVLLFLSSRRSNARTHVYPRMHLHPR